MSSSLPSTSAAGSPMLAFDRVTLRAPVGQGMLLSDISFTVAAGAFVGLVGPSGSGKTSLLRLTNRLLEPSAGEIRWQGRAVRSHPVVAYRQQVTLVLQESKLLGLTVADNLHYPSQLRGQTAAQAQQTAQPWLERLSIPTGWLNKTAVELSVGQRQRVALARALIAAPKVLLLDEPTAAQDLGYAETLLAQLAHLTRSGGLTVIMANHQLALMPSVVTQVLHLEGGQLLSDRAAAEVSWDNLRQAIVAANQHQQDDWEL